MVTKVHIHPMLCRYQPNIAKTPFSRFRKIQKHTMWKIILIIGPHQITLPTSLLCITMIWPITPVHHPQTSVAPIGHINKTCFNALTRLLRKQIFPHTTVAIPRLWQHPHIGILKLQRRNHHIVQTHTAIVKIKLHPMCLCHTLQHLNRSFTRWQNTHINSTLVNTQPLREVLMRLKRRDTHTLFTIAPIRPKITIKHFHHVFYRLINNLLRIQNPFTFTFFYTRAIMPFTQRHTHI